MPNILLSTTSQLDGLKIEKYIDVISAQTVIGTGILSDWLGGVSDVVGGENSTYRMQLDEMKNKCMKLIKEQAVKLGANGIVGINIDYNEVSGKGKQMFMATVTGTAVRVTSLNTYAISLDELLQKTNSEYFKYGRINDLIIVSLEVDKLLEKIVIEEDLSDVQRYRLFKYYWVIGQYASAEDLIYFMVKNSNSAAKETYIKEGINFYKDLLLKSDNELTIGNLPRDEVNEGLAELLKLK